MKKLLLFTVILIFAQSGFSQMGKYSKKPHQQSIKGYISGNILDSITREPIEFAVVELLDGQGKQINGNITDEDGKFKITDVKTGSYKLKLSFIGYTPKVIDSIELTLSKPDLNMGTLILAPSSFMLEDIQIVDQRSLVENNIDKMVYNVSKDATLTGGDATDVLRKVPMLTVDVDGNVSLRGSQRVKILLNGKPSGLFSDNVGETLKMFPADEIEKVEVVTAPGAKYDGEGSAGIVNIVTKKSNVEGMKGSVSTFIGDKMESLHGNIAIGRGRFGANARIGVRYSLPLESSSTFLRETFSGENKGKLSYDGKLDISRLGYGGSIGAFYDFNAYNSINTSLSLRGRNYTKEGETNINKYNSENTLYENDFRTEKSSNTKSSLNWTTDYTKQFKRHKDQKLVLAFQLEGDIHSQDNNKYFKSKTDLENNDNSGLNREYTLQIDYTHPISSAIKLETGAKYILRDLTSDFKRYFTSKDNVVTVDEANTDILDYYQYIYAGYLSSTIKLPKGFGMMAGVRYENTQINGGFDQGNKDFSNDYDNFLPSITISKKFKDFSTIKLSYNERINRPSLREINPFVDNINEENISFGNPDLSPENNKQIELSYSKFFKGAMINAAVYYKKADNLINRYLTIGNDGISRTTYYNIGESNSYGFNTFVSVKLFKILELRGNFNINKYFVNGKNLGKGLKNENIGYSSYLSSNIKLPKDLVIEIWGLFNSPRTALQGITPSFSMFSIALKKEILKGRGKIGLRIIDPFKADKEFTTELKGNNFYQLNKISRPFRSIGLTFSYNFGKLDFKSRRSVIDNNDRKSEGGEDGMD